MSDELPDDSILHILKLLAENQSRLEENHDSLAKDFQREAKDLKNLLNLTGRNIKKLDKATGQLNKKTLSQVDRIVGDLGGLKAENTRLVSESHKYTLWFRWTIAILIPSLCALYVYIEDIRTPNATAEHIHTIPSGAQHTLPAGCKHSSCGK